MPCLVTTLEDACCCRHLLLQHLKIAMSCYTLASHVTHLNVPSSLIFSCTCQSVMPHTKRIHLVTQFRRHINKANLMHIESFSAVFLNQHPPIFRQQQPIGPRCPTPVLHSLWTALLPSVWVFVRVYLVVGVNLECAWVLCCTLCEVLCCPLCQLPHSSTHFPPECTLPARPNQSCMFPYR